jgi:hypothetical protein
MPHQLSVSRMSGARRCFVSRPTHDDVGTMTRQMLEPRRLLPPDLLQRSAVRGL